MLKKNESNKRTCITSEYTIHVHCEYRYLGYLIMEDRSLRMKMHIYRCYLFFMVDLVLV